MAHMNSAYWNQTKSIENSHEPSNTMFVKKRCLSQITPTKEAVRKNKFDGNGKWTF